MNEFPAGLDGITFASAECRLLGAFYRAAGHGPRSTALLLHGLPGVEKNLDIACALRDAGWNSLLFHYRGSWGSGGNYSLFQLEDDVHAAAEWIRRQPSVDTNRIAIIGHSVGGYVAFQAAARDARFRAVVAICPLASPARAPLSKPMFAEFAGMLQGVTASDLQAQYATLPAIESLAPRLADRPILLLTGDQDDIFPPSHYPPLLRVLPHIQWHQLAGGDHSLSSCRPQLTAFVTLWLDKVLGR